MDEIINIIDFHAHAFPDAVAERAIPALEAEAKVPAFLDGKVSSLLHSMDEAGIERSVVCSIATRPQQFEAILTWSKEISSDRIIPFPSIHPDDPEALEQIKRIAGEGFKGIKMHPYYQDFYLAEDRMFPIYEALTAHNLMVVMHTGYDIAFERIDRCGPKQILEVHNRLPEFKLITTHLGAWEQWDEVRELLIGKPIYMDIAFVYAYLGDALRPMLEAHPKEYLLFGTDSPWTEQGASLKEVKGLGLSPELELALLSSNAHRLLEL